MDAVSKPAFTYWCPSTDGAKFSKPGSKHGYSNAVVTLALKYF